MWSAYEIVTEEPNFSLHALLLRQGGSRGGRTGPGLQRGLQGAWQLLRDQLEPAAAYNWMQPLLLLKYISDQWRERRIQLIAEYPLQPDKISAALATSGWRLPLLRLPASLHKHCRHSGGSECMLNFDSLLHRRDQVQIGRLINFMLDQLAQANSSRLQGLFSGFDYDDASLFGDELQRQLLWRAVLLELGRCNLGEAGALQDLHQWTRTKMPPAPGAAFCAALAKRVLLQTGGSRQLRDPFCGQGELLSALLHAGCPAHRLQGWSADANHWRTARMNLVLQQGQEIALLRHNALEGVADCAPADLQAADLSASAPGWDSKMAKRMPQAFPWGAPAKGRPEFAALSRMMMQSAVDGQIMVIVGSHCLQRSGKEQEIRQALATHLLAVILLPTGSGRKRLALLYLSAQKQQVAPWLADYSRVDEAPEDLAERIWREYQAGRDLPWARRVAATELANNQQAWRPDLYLPSRMESRLAEELPLQELEQECARLRTEVQGRLQALGLLSL